MRILLSMLCMLLVLELGAQNGQERVEIMVTYERQAGRGSNQYAVWIEDENENIVKTLFVTNFTAEGGYTRRPDCTPQWVQKAKPQGLTPEQVDGFSGATPQSGNHVYTWDLTDNAGNKVKNGKYTFVVQGTLLSSDQVLFKGKIATEGSEEVLVKASPEFSSGDPKNKDMIKAVEAKYIP